ncbi:MAG: helicase C-terminal domain-containing protein [Calditrichia bacterium]
MDKKEFYKLLNLEEIISVDLETTGLDHDENRITEIGLVLIKNGEIIDEKQWLVNPQQPIPDNIIKLTGITEDMVKGQPAFDDIAEELLDFLAEKPIIGQNVIFDINFLEAAFRRKYKDFRGWQKRYKEYHYVNNKYYDTSFLSRLLFPFFERHSLQHLAKEFDYQPDAAHRALDDAKTAALVFDQLLKNLSQLTLLEIEEVLKLMGEIRNPVVELFQSVLKYNSLLNQDHSDEYDWQHATREHYNILGKIVPGKEDVSEEPLNLLDKQEIISFFDDEGILSKKIKDFVPREPQIDMVNSVTEAFNQGQILTVEAGTGTGKSFAYLVPAIRWVQENQHKKSRVVISTNTKNLQEQLFYKDLPLLKAALNADFSAVLLKGKSNYLCLDKYETILKFPQQRLSVHDRNQAAMLVHWRHLTSTGDISEHHGFMAERNPALWRQFIAEDKYCPGKACKFYDDCHVMKIRNAARNADIVVVNHSLLMSDIAADNAIIGPYDYLIIDEAHNLEKVAIDYLGYGVNFWEFKDIFEALYNNDKKIGLLHQLENSLKLADVDDEELKSSLLQFVSNTKNNLNMHLVKVREEFQNFGIYFNQFLTENNQQIQDNITLRLKQNDPLANHLSELWAKLRPKITNLTKELFEFSESFRNLTGAIINRDQLLNDLLAKINRLDILRANFDFVSSVELTDHVYWVEANLQYTNYDFRFYASPLKIDKILYDRLFSTLQGGILTSATLAVNNEFSYFYQKVGLNYLLPERRTELLLSSPFNFNEQTALLVPLYFSFPQGEPFQKDLEELFEHLLDIHQKGTLVLFTSYSMLRRSYYSLKDKFKSKNILLLGQGIDGSRHNLIRMFKEETSSVLFGTDSFWEGIDVPGEALEQLIITKLPFEVPSDPIVEAKCEYLQEQGKNSFMDYMLPESIIKLKQGFGRLIRTVSDRGIVIITDHRILTKRYGNIIRKSLPVPVKSFERASDLFQFIDEWYRKTIDKGAS